MSLNESQKLFCEYYIANGRDGKKAYSSAYNREPDQTCEVNASRLLSDAKIMEYIATLLKPLHEKLGITAEYILSGIKHIADNAMKPTKGGDMVEDDAVRLKAYETLAKHKDLALFADKQNINHTFSEIPPININVSTKSD